MFGSRKSMTELALLIRYRKLYTVKERALILKNIINGKDVIKPL